MYRDSRYINYEAITIKNITISTINRIINFHAGFPTNITKILINEPGTVECRDKYTLTFLGAPVLYNNFHHAKELGINCAQG